MIGEMSAVRRLAITALAAVAATLVARPAPA
jgi:hypothetical protein